jgi:hypothetical protein
MTADGPKREATPRWDPAAATGTAATRWDGDGRIPDDVIEQGVEKLRKDAVSAARADAEIGVPAPEQADPPESEFELRERCRAFLQRLKTYEHRQRTRDAAELEERVTSQLPKAALAVDRYERITNDLTRLRVRRTSRKREVTDELARGERTRQRGIPTNVYLLAIAFLGVVEFFANAPVFSALLPRDPLTERQIRLLSETSDGWFAGVERVFAHIFLKPDAALLAGGVIVFLMVLAHFFGHSLREVVIHWDRRFRRDTVASRSALESTVPIVITGIGLALTLGVLFEARVMLGAVGEERYEQDIAQVEELRREAGWLRVDGDLVGANQLENRADDMQEAAIELREYAGSMARMSFPILLLNLTLVLCAIAAAYFHKRDARSEQFNDDAFEDDRAQLVEQAESTAAEVGTLLAESLRDIRKLKVAAHGGEGEEWRAVVPQLEAVIALYRAENGRTRGMDSRSIPAFREQVRLSLDFMESNGERLVVQAPDEYEQERAALQARFDVLRQRYTEESRA